MAFRPDPLPLRLPGLPHEKFVLLRTAVTATSVASHLGFGSPRRVIVLVVRVRQCEQSQDVSSDYGASCLVAPCCVCWDLPDLDPVLALADDPPLCIAFGEHAGRVPVGDVFGLFWRVAALVINVDVPFNYAAHVMAGRQALAFITHVAAFTDPHTSSRTIRPMHRLSRYPLVFIKPCAQERHQIVHDRSGGRRIRSASSSSPGVTPRLLPVSTSSSNFTANTG